MPKTGFACLTVRQPCVPDYSPLFELLFAKDPAVAGNSMVGATRGWGDLLHGKPGGIGSKKNTRKTCVGGEGIRFQGTSVGRNPLLTSLLTSGPLASVFCFLFWILPRAGAWQCERGTCKASLSGYTQDDRMIHIGHGKIEATKLSERQTG